jgi:hypothetical protein
VPQFEFRIISLILFSKVWPWAKAQVCEQCRLRKLEAEFEEKQNQIAQLNLQDDDIIDDQQKEEECQKHEIQKKPAQSCLVCRKEEQERKEQERKDQERKEQESFLSEDSDSDSTKEFYRALNNEYEHVHNYDYNKLLERNRCDCHQKSNTAKSSTLKSNLSLLILNDMGLKFGI